MREFVVCNGLAIKSDNTKNKIMNRYVFSLIVFLLLSIITSFITNNSFIDKITSNYLENTMSLLKGEYGFMCQYEDPNFQTVWSSIFNLKNLMIYRAEGDPRKKKFITDSRLHDIKFGR